LPKIQLLWQQKRDGKKVLEPLGLVRKHVVITYFLILPFKFTFFSLKNNKINKNSKIKSNENKKTHNFIKAGREGFEICKKIKLEFWMKL
jgi:hypothetical protein